MLCPKFHPSIHFIPGSLLSECHPIHVAGNLPNRMSRFVPTNWLEVLFVN
jgi:hypothetical protein